MKRRSEIPAKEAALRLGVGLGYVYHLVWSGKLRATRRDGRWFIPVAAIEQRLKGEENGTVRR